MKSSIKVAYASTYESGINDKQPIIRVEVSQTDDDPRDSLLRSIFSPKLEFNIFQHKNDVNSGNEVYVLAVKNDYSKVCDLYGIIYSVLSIAFPNTSDALLVTSSDEFYFEKQPDSANTKYERSKGINRGEAVCLTEYELIKKAVADFRSL